MAISNVAIANRALQKLGAKRIESLTQDHPNARSINACFDLVRDAELRRYDWAFAISRASIAASTSDTLFGSWNRFAVPNDYLRLLLDDEDDTVVDWRLEGKYEPDGESALFIITQDAAPLEIRYIARVTDPTTFDALFIDALTCKIAIECCEEITGSNSKKESLKDDYKFAINEAKRLGSIERSEKDPPEDEWVAARR